MKKVIIIDDETLARSLVKKHLAKHEEFQIVDECGDGFEASKSIIKNNPDLIFLDIQMPRISGFELLEILENPPAVIFTTAFDEFALKAFESNAIDYLLKPFSSERFDKAINKYLTLHPNPEQLRKLLNEVIPQQTDQERIVVKNGADIRIVPIADIVYFEAMDDYVKIFTQNGMFMKKQTLSFYEKQLEERGFVRIHRSILLNSKELYRIEPSEKDQYLAITKSGKKLSLSRQGYSRLRDKLGI
jgi:two-component system, LytTR family, response regulator